MIFLDLSPIDIIPAAMAINKGVSEPDLEFIKNNSYKIVENAFESEKINWKSLISEFQNPLKTKLS